MSDTTAINITTDLLQMITTEQAWHYMVVPKAAENGHMEFYTSEDHWEEWMGEELEMVLGKTVKSTPLPAGEFRLILGKYYRKNQGNKSATQVSFKADAAEDFVISLIAEANAIGSSDIHIETYEDRCRVRLRIDGKLIEKYVIPQEDYPALVNKLKIRSRLDIAEKRLPQDGRISFERGEDRFDIRVSILPTLHGEKIVLRLLSRDATNIDIATLGMGERQLVDYMEGVKKSHGIVLISGPTGSGKTTTLYATLKELNDEKSNIVTIEDPIEYTLEGINQVQLKEDIGLGFADALRSFLRQDPDIIMLGEIRDNETAQMAIRAALTGHLVLSTVHTNSAWGTVSRIVDMGVPSYLLASTLNVTVAQRLVRLLCDHCKKESDFDHKLFPSGFTAPRQVHTHYLPEGCEHCHYTGYTGRMAVYEVIPIDFELAERIKKNAFEVSDYLKQQKIVRLMDSAFELFQNGKTSLEEVYALLMSNY